MGDSPAWPGEGRGDVIDGRISPGDIEGLIGPGDVTPKDCGLG